MPDRNLRSVCTSQATGQVTCVAANAGKTVFERGAALLELAWSAGAVLTFFVRRIAKQGARL